MMIPYLTGEFDNTFITFIRGLGEQTIKVDEIEISTGETWWIDDKQYTDFDVFINNLKGIQETFGVIYTVPDNGDNGEILYGEFEHIC